jgi:hypothetical protein
MADRFVVIAQRTDGDFVIRAPHELTREKDEVEDAQFIFDTCKIIQTIRLYRVDFDTAQPVHVRTWTRRTDLAEVV